MGKHKKRRVFKAKVTVNKEKSLSEMTGLSPRETLETLEGLERKGLIKIARNTDGSMKTENGGIFIKPTELWSIEGFNSLPEDESSNSQLV